jgi:hypothetical protein
MPGVLTKTVYPRFSLTQGRDLYGFSLDLSRHDDRENSHVDWTLDTTGTQRTLAAQVVDRAKVNQTGQARVSSTNGWLLTVVFEAADEVDVVSVATGAVVAKSGNTYIVRTTEAGVFNAEFTHATWAGIRAHVTAIRRIGDTLVVEPGTSPGGLPWLGDAGAAPSGSANATTATVNFGAGDTYVETVVTGKSWVTSGMTFIANVAGEQPGRSDEDGILEELQVSVGDVVAGAGFTVRAYAPNSAFGSFVVNVIGV